MACQNRCRCSLRHAGGRPGERIAERLVRAAIQPADRPITHLHVEVLRAPIESTQYTSAEFAAHLGALKLQGSMGRIGQCWDNALAESFFAALKNELVYQTVFASQAIARRAVAEYIEVFYNRTRLHSGLGYKTPQEVAHIYRQNTAKAA